MWFTILCWIICPSYVIKAAMSCTSSSTMSISHFFKDALLAFLDIACAASNPSSSTDKPSSSAIKRVRSTGNPNVSYNRNTSLPLSSFSPLSLDRDANWSNSFSPRSNVREKKGFLFLVQDLFNFAHLNGEFPGNSHPDKAQHFKAWTFQRGYVANHCLNNHWH